MQNAVRPAISPSSMLHVNRLVVGGWTCAPSMGLGRQHHASRFKALSTIATTTTELERIPHQSVLLQEILDTFKGRSIQTYVDCTLGAAGHASAMLAQHPEMKVVVGFDLDTNAIEIAQNRLNAIRPPHTSVHIVNSNYSNITEHLKNYPGSSLVGRVDGIVMDLGVSSMQIDTAERGFSFMQDGPLDMRMDPAGSLSAEEILNTWSEVQLAEIIRDYGEEKLWKAVARRIVKAREEEPIRTTQQLVKAIGYTSISKDKKGPKQIHPATRTFQAIRIAVNDELGKLEKAIPRAIECMAPGGRMGVISFHGLEDRIVKHAFLKAAGKGKDQDNGPITFYSQPTQTPPAQAATVKLLNKKPIIPTEEEIQLNSRSRSAKLRFVERL